MLFFVAGMAALVTASASPMLRWPHLSLQGRKIDDSGVFLCRYLSFPPAPDMSIQYS
jgi:hypothetical protein